MVIYTATTIKSMHTRSSTLCSAVNEASLQVWFNYKTKNADIKWFSVFLRPYHHFLYFDPPAVDNKMSKWWNGADNRWLIIEISKIFFPMTWLYYLHETLNSKMMYASSHSKQIWQTSFIVLTDEELFQNYSKRFDQGILKQPNFSTEKYQNQGW